MWVRKFRLHTINRNKPFSGKKNTVFTFFTYCESWEGTYILFTLMTTLGQKATGMGSLPVLKKYGDMVYNFKSSKYANEIVIKQTRHLHASLLLVACFTVDLGFLSRTSAFNLTYYATTRPISVRNFSFCYYLRTLAVNYLVLRGVIGTGDIVATYT